MNGERTIYLPGNKDPTEVMSGHQCPPRRLIAENIETRMANMRISEPVKYPPNYHRATSPAFDITKPNQGGRARPNISSIQNRPLPPPGTSGVYRPGENIYQSPVRPAHFNQDLTGPRPKQNQEQKPPTRHSCDFSPNKSKLPIPHQPVRRSRDCRDLGLGKRSATELEFSRPCVRSQLAPE